MIRIGLILLGIIFIIETIYFNIIFDYLLIVFVLVLAFGIGGIFKINSRGLDLILVKIALGLGILGFIVWLSTFYDIHGKSSYILLSGILLYYRYKYIKKDFEKIYTYIKKFSNTHGILLIIIISALIFYTIPASYPIQQWDSLAKHIVIPMKILNHGYYDYNVVESIIFGDFALCTHMFYLFLLTLGGTKALVLFNVVISFITLIVILRITALITKRVLPLNVIALLFFTTPLIYNYSTILNIDIYPIFFMAVSLLLIQYDKIKFLMKNLPFIALLFGFAFFSKQVAFYMIVPLCIYLIFLIIKGHKKISSTWFATILLSIGLFFLPFLPSMILIWYKTGNPLFPFLNEIFKSDYFPILNFEDPYAVWQRFLGLDFKSLWSIVFNTANNTEYMNGGAGFHLLLLPFTLILWPFLLRNRRFFSLLFVTIGAYWISVTFFNPNIRYFLGSIVFAIPLVVIALDTALGKLNNERFRNLLVFIVLIVLVSPNLYVITKPTNSLGFKSEMLTPNSKLTQAPNEDILRTINHSDVYLLSNNDNLRGTFKGHFYTLSWYNSMILLSISQKTDGTKVCTNNCGLEFLRNFDYYLVDKLLPLAAFDPTIYKNLGYRILDPDESQVEKELEKVDETERFKLYKIKKNYKVIMEENFIEPISVTVDKPEVKSFTRNNSKYKVSIDAAPISPKETIGRFQINWLNKDGKFLGVSIIPFNLNSNRTIYDSELIDNIPENAVIGHLYITSHTLEAIKVYGFKLSATGEHLLQYELERYGKKVMKVYK